MIVHCNLRLFNSFSNETRLYVHRKQCIHSTRTLWDCFSVKWICNSNFSDVVHNFTFWFYIVHIFTFDKILSVLTDFQLPYLLFTSFPTSKLFIILCNETNKRWCQHQKYNTLLARNNSFTTIHQTYTRCKKINISWHCLLHWLC